MGMNSSLKFNPLTPERVVIVYFLSKERKSSAEISALRKMLRNVPMGTSRLEWIGTVTRLLSDSRHIVR